MDINNYSNYLCDLRFLEKYKKDNLDENMEKLIKEINLDDYFEDFCENEEYSNFYTFLFETEGSGGDFVIFDDTDNPKEFETNVLYLVLDEKKLYIKQKTEYCEFLESLNINFKFANYKLVI
ncbi:hypothetical protein [Cetobacterium sp.]|uniref:hypothetical protein n=1 Tax=Cetobacterium sp. TaxID=2071632 RepID=UPI003F3A1BE0